MLSNRAGPCSIGHTKYLAKYPAGASRQTPEKRDDRERNASVTDFIPPYPPRLRRPPWPWTRLRLARANSVAMWEESAFTLEFSHERVFTRTTFLCNSPEAVQFAFNLKNASFERKGPQTRHSLEPLIGDSLFITDGENWRQRRQIIAPILHASRLGEFSKVMVETATELRERWAGLSGEVDVLEE
ncbi:MAG: cytochrome P450, partial [Pseudolabrys sp.]